MVSGVLSSGLSLQGIDLHNHRGYFCRVLEGCQHGGRLTYTGTDTPTGVDLSVFDDLIPLGGVRRERGRKQRERGGVSECVYVRVCVFVRESECEKAMRNKRIE